MSTNYLKAVFWDYPELCDPKVLRSRLMEARSGNDHRTLEWIMARFPPTCLGHTERTGSPCNPFFYDRWNNAGRILSPPSDLQRSGFLFHTLSRPGRHRLQPEKGFQEGPVSYSVHFRLLLLLDKRTKVDIIFDSLSAVERRPLVGLETGR